jgi:hypothetical protein
LSLTVTPIYGPSLCWGWRVDWYRIFYGVRRRYHRAIGRPAEPKFDDFGTQDADLARRRVGQPSEIADLFFASTGRLVHKWPHYLPVYERHFAPYRGTPVKMLEIGVSQGGSLELWRRYFGQDAVIFGIDIDPACAQRVDPPNQVRIGSQADPDFLRAVVSEMGAPDIILDDGSHIASHQRASFETLFPLLRDGGLYLIEDVHTAYWSWLEGGHRRPGTAIEFAKSLIDDMHAWYHPERTRTNAKTEISGISFHDSLVVIEKRNHASPVHFKVGPAV